MNLVPFVKALALGEVTMEHGDFALPVRKARLEALDGLGCERDFGDKDNDGLALL